MINDGSLPAGERCALSGKPTLDVVNLTIKVPTAFQQKGGQGLQILLGVFVTVWVFLLPSIFARTVPLEHSAGILDVPLRISGRLHAKLRKAGQGRLKRVLRTVPIYAQLLEENPFASVSVAAPASTTER